MSLAAVTVAVLVWAALSARPAAPNARMRRLLGAPGGHTRALSMLGAGRRSDRTGGGPDLAATVSELAALLRAGLAPPVAWAYLAAGTGQGAGRVPTVVAGVARASASGEDVAAALRAAADATRRDARSAGQADGLLALAAAWEVVTRSGAPAADVLDRLAATLRDDIDAADARAGAMAAPLATARVLGALPLAGLVLGQLVGADPLAVLATTGPGRVCAAGGAVLVLLGRAWTRRLIRLATLP